MTKRFLIAAALAAVTPTVSSAQAPTVGPEGDPSIQDDTVYALAVDPADHPEESSVLLLDDGILVQEPDGTGSRTYRMVAQILNRDAVEGWAEHTWGYDGDREEFRLNWVRVLDLEGNLITDEPIHQQVMDMPVPEQSPVYTNWKRVRVSLGGVEPGTIVDYSYTIETVDPVMPGDFASNWSITTGGTVRRSRLIVDVPADRDLPVFEENVREGKSVREENGRRIGEWIAADQEWLEPEYFAAVLEAPFMARVQIGGWNSWAEIGAWYGELAGDRYELDDDVIAAAEAAVGDGTDRERLEALYRWIAQDFRYISISLGQGGYQPRPPAEVLATRSGDCKDKATIFIALAREMGFEAYPVLLNSVGGVEQSLPSVKQFNHVIAAVRLDGRWTYLDLTAEIIPFGNVSPGYQGEFGLIVFDDGSVEEIEFPENDPAENRTETVLKGELLDDGSFTGWYTERSEGALQYSLRGQLAQQEFTQRELDLAADAVAAGVLEGAVGDSLQLFDGFDLDAEPVISVKVSAPRVARPGGGGHFLELPIETFGNQALIVGLEEELDTRRYPIDVGQVVGPIVTETRFEVTLPEGWTAELPESVRVESRFGTYASDYVQDGRVLRVTRRVQGREGTEPPDALPDLIDFLRGIANDDTSFILLQSGE